MTSIRRIMFIPTRLRVIPLLLAAPLVLRAQDPNASQAELIQALLTRIDRLEKRVAKLESKTTMVAQEPAPAGAHAPAVHASPDHEAPALSGAPSLRLA